MILRHLEKRFKNFIMLKFLKIGVGAVAVVVVLNGHAADLTSEPASASTADSGKPKWTYFHPYAPYKREYNAEVGGMWEAENLYWLGLTYGHHLGQCRFFFRQSCEQYFDVTGGFGSREAYTDGLVLAGVRWQYVSFPQPYSPSFKIFTGVMNIRDDQRDRQVGVYGFGVAFTASLHEKLDIKWENRIGGGDQFWTQSLISISLKIDRWVDRFADNIKRLGSATVETTGTVIKSTIQAPQTFRDWFNRSRQNPQEDEKQNLKEEEKKNPKTEPTMGD